LFFQRFIHKKAAFFYKNGLFFPGFPQFSGGYPHSEKEEIDRFCKQFSR
jgi:hypothetical protein